MIDDRPTTARPRLKPGKNEKVALRADNLSALPARWADAEKQLLGNILARPSDNEKRRQSHVSAMRDAKDRLKDYRWSNTRNDAIFQAAIRIAEKAEYPGPAAVQDELCRINNTEAANYAAELAAEYFSDAELNHWLEQCLELSMACGIYAAADQVKLALDAGKTTADIKPLLEELAHNRFMSRADDDPVAPPAEHQAFPIYALPPVMAEFAQQCAEAMGCPIEYVVLPMLAVAASAIGNTRLLQIKNAWKVPAILWVCVIGKSGTGKSPPADHVLESLKKRQSDKFRECQQAQEPYKIELAEFKRKNAAFISGKSQCEPGPEPQAPACIRYVVDDATLEALAKILGENPRGVLLFRDELSGWFSSMDAYRKGGDLQRWLSIYRAESFTVDRKQGTPPTIHIPRAVVSICGGIQPDILRAMMTRDNLDSGLMARILFAAPPAHAKQWTDADLNAEAKQKWAGIVDDLLNLAMGQDINLAPEPLTLELTCEAQGHWIPWYNENAQRTVVSDGPVAAALAKIEESAARLALIFGLVNDPSAAEIDAGAMQNGIIVAKWFRSEAERLYALYSESREEAERRKLIELIQRRGGRISARELARGPQQYRKPGSAEKALEGLISSGVARWDSVETEGRRQTVCCLIGRRSNGPAKTVDADPPIKTEGMV